MFNIVEKLGNTKAVARTILGYARTSEEIYYFDGFIRGNIISPNEKSGFGWDPIFQPEGYFRSFSELTQEEKNKISMRRIALNKLNEFIGAKN